MTDADHQHHKFGALPLIHHPIVANPQSSQPLKFPLQCRVGIAARALAAESLIRSEQRITHFGPIEHGVGRVFQGVDPEA